MNSQPFPVPVVSASASSTLTAVTKETSSGRGLAQVRGLLRFLPVVFGVALCIAAICLSVGMFTVSAQVATSSPSQLAYQVSENPELGRIFTFVSFAAAGGLLLSFSIKQERLTREYVGQRLVLAMIVVLASCLASAMLNLHGADDQGNAKMQGIEQGWLMDNYHVQGTLPHGNQSHTRGSTVASVLFTLDDESGKTHYFVRKYRIGSYSSTQQVLVEELTKAQAITLHNLGGVG